MKRMKQLCKMMLLTAGLSASAAHASELLVSFTSGSGFVPELYAESHSCKIYSDKIEVSNWYAGIDFTETRALDMNNDQKLQDLIAKLFTQKAKVISVLPADIPYTNVSVHSGTDSKTVMGHERDNLVAIQSDEARVIERMLTGLCSNYK